ncbi:hypothetical protein BJV77DRAFT_1070277 [Russula vinacea]|nr:hypothetical protein BJV77DRAFT_1070277 [Russula vinacea]
MTTKARTQVTAPARAKVKTSQTSLPPLRIRDPQPTRAQGRRCTHNTTPTQRSEHDATTTPHQQHTHIDKVGDPRQPGIAECSCEQRGTGTCTKPKHGTRFKRAQARGRAPPCRAVRIQREQVVRGFEDEIYALRARIGALREECEVRVARVQRGWERERRCVRAAMIERGEVEHEDEGEVMVTGLGLGPDVDADVDGEMEVNNTYAPTETSLTTDDGDDEEPWPSRSPPPHWSHFETPSPPPPLLQRQRQESHVMKGISSSSGEGPSRLEPEAMEEDEDSQPCHQNQDRPQPQPLRRQPAQLMAIPISSLDMHAYGTAALIPGNRLRDMDKDSEMGE